MKQAGFSTLMLPLFLLSGNTALRGQVPILGEPPTASSPAGSNSHRGADALVLPQATTPNWFDITNRATVRDTWNLTFAPTTGLPVGWTGDVVSNSPGTTLQSYKDAVATRINWFRAMAGVPVGIVLDPTYSAKDQKAALMFSANRTLSHNPPSNWTDYTADGAEAAGKSNICAGFGPNTDTGCVVGYMIDNGSNNTVAGHRSALLFPQTQSMGTGDVPQSGPDANPYYWANAIWVQDANIFGTRPATRQAYVAWPPPGYVPYQVVGPRWSFSYPGADFSGASVTMKRNGATVPVRLEPLSFPLCLPPFLCFPENTLVWVPDNLDTSSFTPVAPATDTTSTVTITNVLVNGVAKSFTYSVTIFDPATTGGAAGPPTVTSVTPAFSSGANQTITVTINAPGGYQSLNVINVLINNVLDGRAACYLAYVQPANVLYIVPDSGDGTQLSGKVMDGTGTVSNSQCTITLANSTAIGSGNTFTLTVNATFPTSFAGNKVIYAAARDLSANNSGWQTAAVHNVPGATTTYPNPVGITPASASTLSTTLTFQYQDQASASNFQTVWALINTAIDARSACYVAYYRPGNLVLLFPDSGDGTQATSMVLAGNNTVSNSQCTVSAQGASVQSTGQALNVTLPITFKTAFAGFKGIWLAANTLGGQTSLWQALGAVAVPGQ